MARRVGAVRLANEQVSILLACRLIGMRVPEHVDAGRSIKVPCPWGEIYHRDRGSDPSFRIYPDSNSAWCFSCAMRYTPVWLVAQAWGIGRHQAAVELLERAGIKPVTLAQAWQAATRHDEEPDRALLAEALKTYCERICPRWEDVQFEPGVAGLLSRCLGLLERVRTDEDADRWLACCKQVMSSTLYSSQT